MPTVLLKLSFQQKKKKVMAPLENLSRNYTKVKGKRQRKGIFVITENLMRTYKSFPQIKRSEIVTIVTVKFRGLLVC